MSEEKTRTRMPIFFVVGAQKAGTTTLHQRLLECSDVSLPITKETHFFSSDEAYNRGVRWYQKQFASKSDNAILGEVAPDYLFSKSAPERIKKWVSDPRFIFIFRHPVHRALSNYRMAVRNGYEKLPFRQALLEEARRMESGDATKISLFGYMSRGMYSRQVERYFETFPKGKFLFIKFDDFIKPGEEGQMVFRQICDFIGVKMCGDVDLDKKANVASMARSSLLRNFLYQPSRLKHLLRILVPSYDLRARIAYYLDRLNQRPIEVQVVADVPKQLLIDISQDIKKLQQLTKLDLEDWLIEIDEMLAGAG